MVIGTSDGKYYESEFEQIADQQLDRGYADWKQKNAPNDTGEDYDLQAAYKSGLNPAANGHFPDTYKKPNHFTFSNESIYHGVDGNEGGRWGEENGITTFTPGKTNLQHHTPAELEDYFKRVEPGAKLIFPGTAQHAELSRVDNRPTNVGMDPNLSLADQRATAAAQEIPNFDKIVNHKAFKDFLEAQTPSTNIEDRRGENTTALEEKLNQEAVANFLRGTKQ